MLALLLSAVLLIAVPMVAGFITSRRHRREDRRNFSAFVGFSVGIVAVIATILYLSAAIVWIHSLRDAYSHPARQGLIFVSGVIGIVASLVASCVGLFTVGIRRVALVIFGPVMCSIYVLAAFSSFGK
jgi:hypothetical protein